MRVNYARAKALLTQVYATERARKRNSDVDVVSVMPDLIHSQHLPYRFGEVFSRELGKTKVDFSMLPYFPVAPTGKANYQTNYHIQFGNHWIFISAQRFPGPVTAPSGKAALGMIRAIVFEPEGLRCDYSYYNVLLGGDHAEIFSPEEMIDVYYDEEVKEEFRGKQVLRARMVANAILYIHSGNPDLREYRKPGKEIPRRQRDDLIRQFGNEDCILVSWGWQKPVQRTAEGWPVRGCMVWQPCGPNHSQRRWQWRSESWKSWREKDTP